MVNIQNNRQPSEGVVPGNSLFNDATDWLVVHVDACSYGRAGLQFVLEHLSFAAGKKRVVGASSLDEALRVTRPYLFNGRAVRCLVVRLPSQASEALITLLQLSEVMQYDVVRYHQVVVLSPFDTVAVQRLVTIMGMADARVVDARLSPLALCNAVLFAPEKRIVEGWCLSQVLTEHERNALRQSLQFWPIPMQAKLRQVSPKTVYSQRFRALMKLGVQDIRTLLNLLVPGKKENMAKGSLCTGVNTPLAARGR
ncbi:helix-turn-helix domain-containing protein [Serratia marcescens]|uniref:hypothetical protein n=1 Tax=Serratia marcescens TaxID=615 RepID=UPI00074518AD|nr:hypothetical protein [Serratia marcescens]CVF70741.1 Uncharacterised protein [Serratia marcescens]